MQTVLGLIPDHRMLSLDYRIGYLFTAMGGQAVQHDAIRFCQGHQRIIQAVAGKGLLANLLFSLLPHAGPDIGIDHVGSGDRNFRVGRQRDLAGSLGHGPLHDRGIRLVPLRAGQSQLEAENRRSLDPGVGHIVAIADPGEDQSFIGALLLDNRHQVGHDLAGVKQVGQAVDYRHVRVARKFIDDFLAEGADHHAVTVAGHDPCSILDRLAAPHLGVGGRDEQSMPPQLKDPHLEGDPGPGGSLLEDQRHGLAVQQFMGNTLFLFLFQFTSQGQHPVKLNFVEVVQRQKMSRHQYIS